MMQGTQVTLNDMLDCRERRASRQMEYIKTYQKPVISFCMNIPGPIKTTPELYKLFQEGTALIYRSLEQEHLTILDSTEYHNHTGDELILCVNCDHSTQIKKSMTSIEETHPLGRLFDIDVIDIDGNKLSRNSFRKCFLCDRQAQDCAASRRHSVDEMQHAIEQKIGEFYDSDNTVR